MELIAILFGLLLLWALTRRSAAAPVQQEQEAAAPTRRRRTTTRRKPLKTCSYCGKAIRDRASNVLGNPTHGKCAAEISDHVGRNGW